MSDESEITLDRLFRPTRVVKVGGKCLVVRALSGPEQEERSLYAVNQSRILEKKLADPESDTYQFRMRMLDELPAEALVTLLRESRSAETRRRLERENPPVYQPFPENPTDDEKRAVLNSREQAEVERVAKNQASEKADADDYQSKTLDGKTREQLMELAKSQTRAAMLAERANMAYAHYTLYLAVQNEDGSRYFKNAEDAGSLQQEVVFHLYREFQVANDLSPLKLSGA